MSDANNAIAIVGMALRFPGASTPQQFWKNLIEGRDCARTLDRDALARLGVAEEKLSSPEYVYRSYDLDDIDKFDARFFGISPREARMADPQLRIMLEVAHECIEDSAHVLRNTNTGMYLGVADHKWWMYYSLFQSPLEEQNEVAKRIYAIKDFFATQVSHKLGLAGPSISLSSACSTGLLATHEACNHLLLYDCDYALAGGCEVLQGAGYQYLEGGLSARDGYVRAFDKDASGTVFGSGAAMVLLRRLDDAIADGDKIYAVIRATAVNNDGDQKVGYMAPGVKGQMEVIRSAIERAGVNARDIGYVEAHGTGTKVGDPIEIESISRVYRRYTQDRQYCGIGSVKTNVGHLSIAAGMAGLIKTTLMLHHRKIPPTLHFKEANPAIDFGSSPFYVCRELADWAPYGGKRIAGISAFGVGGTNAHAIVEEAPVPREESALRPGHRVLVVTGKTETALAASKQRLAQFVRENPSVALSDVAFSLNTGRQKFDHRSWLVANTVQELIQACEHAEGEAYNTSAHAIRRPVFMFPGQGAQYPDMALQLYREEPWFAEQVDACLEQARGLTAIDLATILFPSEKDASSTADLIHRTEYAQICLFIVCYSLAQLWMRWGIRPQAMIGHSIGEYVAACLAGVFDLRDALVLVAHRGRLMQSMPPGSMLSVPLSSDAARPYLDDSVCVAGENSPASCVVAGTIEAIGKLKDRLQDAGVKSSVLRTSHAFHSYMMQPVLDRYEAIVRQVQLHEPEIPLISNVTGTWLTAEQATNPHYWAQQLRAPVLFSKGLQTLYSPDSVFIEVGPGTTLCSLLGQHDFESECACVNTLPRAKEATGAAETLAAAVGKACCFGLHVDWDAVYPDGGRRISLPAYPFERKSYWIDEETLRRPTQFAAAAVTPSAPLEHPLLGRRIVSSAKAVVFENIIDKDTPKFIADHRLVETVIFPGAGYTQMALEIGKFFVKNKKIRVDEIRFAQVMMLHEGVRKVVQVVATASGSGCTFEILSRDLTDAPDGEGHTWTLHARGKISAHSVDAPSMQMPVLAQSATHELLPLSRYYDALKFITFGPSFRAIKRLWIGETPQGELESVGRVELPAHLYGEVDRYSFHPVLLDAAFQVIDGPKISQTGTLPVGLRSFTVYDAVPNSFYVHAIRRQREDEEYSIGEITVFSERGQVIAKIEHYLQKEIADSAAADDQLADVLFSIRWEAVQQQIAKNAGSARKTWLVAGSDEAVLGQLSAELSSHGRQVVTLAEHEIDPEGQGPAHALLRRSEVDTVLFANCLSARAEPHADALNLSLNVVRLAQMIAKCEPDAPPRIVIATRGAQLVGEEIRIAEDDAHQAALWGIGTTLRAERPEYRTLTADLDDAPESFAAFIADLTQGETLECQLAYRKGQRSTPRLVKYAANEGDKTRLRVPSGPFEVRLARFGSFDHFVAREIVPDVLADDEVLVEMRAAALNFKETLYVLGYLNPNARQAPSFDFGMEGAGRIKRVGARVTHLKKGDDVIIWHNGCLSSDFVVNVDKVVPKPAHLSYEQAACIPTVFLTAYHALHNLARIKPGDKVLIHAAAGGVGQVAVQIARAAGAEIFATASRGKWAHLREQGVDHVLDSRSLDFAQQIREITRGAGVRIVLNSLAGEFIERSFDSLANGGCFVEIGKKEIWSRERAAAYRPDADYQPFEIGEGGVSGGIGGAGIISELMTQVLADLATGALQPLPMTQFPVGEVQQAYRFLAAGKNIGKVVVSFDAGRGARPSAAFVRPDRTYLVTGGLGALGFLSAEWLIGLGARHIVLTGRRAPTGRVADQIRDFCRIGLDVRVACADVAERADVARILAEIDSGDAPLGGILHCAGVLEDALLQEQTPAKFANVFRPKVLGGLNLHVLTRERPLDFFVCFSSVSAILDGGGQSNYAAANAFLDRLMSHRRSQGLSGLSVNWGAWADVGMAAELAAKRAMDMDHFISAGEAFLALERLIVNRDVQGVVCKLGNRVAEASSRLLADLAQRADDGEQKIGDLERIFRKNPANTPVQNLELFLVAQVNKVLGVGSNEPVPLDAELVSLGVDSLSMTELKNAVQRGIGKSMKMATFFANPTVARLAKHLAAEYADLLTFAASPTATPQLPAVSASAPASCIDFVSMGADEEGEYTLFCFPGLNGNIYEFTDLAALSKERLRIFVGEMGSELGTLETDIRRIAADAIAGMKRIQAHGPYALVGYSYGGVVALEIASQLRKAGDTVNLLTMVDSFPHFRFREDPRFMSFMSALIVDSILTPMKLEAAEYDRLARQIMVAPAEAVADLLKGMATESSAASRVNVALLRNIFEAGKQRSLAVYEPPGHIAGVTINYVRAGDYPRSMALAKLDGFLEEAAMRDEKYAWSDFVDNRFVVHRVEAQHNAILKARTAKAIVAIIENALGIERDAPASA